MAGDGITVRLEGIDELKRALGDAAVKIRTKAVRAALREAGKVIQAQAKVNAPLLKAPARNRRRGTVARNISVRPSKFARRDGNEGVYVSVRPLRGSRQKKLGRAGANNPNDPFYWVFQEFGWQPRAPKKGKGPRAQRVPGRYFMTSAAQTKGQEAISVFMNRVVPQIEKLNERAGRVG